MKRLLAMLLLVGVGPKSLLAQEFTNGYWTYYIAWHGGAAITKYSGPGGIVNVPELLDGNPVKTIGQVGNVVFTNPAITSINFGANLIGISPGIFLHPTNLQYISVNQSNQIYSSIDGVLFSLSTSYLVKYPQAKQGTSYTIPSSVRTVGESAFGRNEYLTNITIPNSVTNVEMGAFGGLTNLKDIIIPNSITNISDGMFGYSGLTNLNIPSSVKRIGIVAFRGCQGLTNVIIPNTVTNIESFAFQDCVNLKTIVVPNGVTRIGGWAFTGNTSLTEFVIPESVTRLDDGTFNGCSSLTKVVFPKTFFGFGSYNFDGCSNLTQVYFLNNGPSSANSLNAFPASATFYYLPGASGWSATDFSNRPTALILPKIKNYTSIPTNGFFRQNLSLSTFSSVNYTIQKSSDLSTWSNQTNFLGNGSEITYTEDSTNSRAFYRIGQQ